MAHDDPCASRARRYSSTASARPRRHVSDSLPRSLTSSAHACAPAAQTASLCEPRHELDRNTPRSSSRTNAKSRSHIVAAKPPEAGPVAAA